MIASPNYFLLMKLMFDYQKTIASPNTRTIQVIPISCNLKDK